MNKRNLNDKIWYYTNEWRLLEEQLWTFMQAFGSKIHIGGSTPIIQGMTIFLEKPNPNCAHKTLSKCSTSNTEYICEDCGGLIFIQENSK